MKIVFLLMSLLLAVSQYACEAQSSEDSFDEEGKLSTNGLLLTHASLSFLTTSPLSKKKVGDDYILDEVAFGELVSAEGGLSILSYLATCALGKDQTLRSESTGKVFVGNLNLEPQWLDKTCDKSCQRWLSACLLAHSNQLEKSVTILLRGPHPKLNAQKNIEGYSYQESAFYGNLFRPDNEHQIYACEGMGIVNAKQETSKEHIFKGRICGFGKCQFQYTGICQLSQISGVGEYGTDTCNQFQNGHYYDCSVKSGDNNNDSENFQEVITVYLSN